MNPCILLRLRGPLIALWVLVLAISFPISLYASTNEAVSELKNIACSTNIPIGGEAKIYQIIGAIINIVLGLLGLVTLILIIYSGFEWMTAGGNTERIDSAKKRMLSAVIGLAIILGAAVLTNFVLDLVLKAIQ